MQITIVILVVASALTYASWRIYKALKGDADPCSDCKLKKNCQKFGQSKEK
jgi:uncharacterized protein (UPF0179 family)